jgi:hypothetical protein
MTREQRIAALMLRQCRFLPGSFEKRFIHSMHVVATTTPEKELTPKQAACLERITERYRRQLAAVPIPSDTEVG